MTDAKKPIPRPPSDSLQHIKALQRLARARALLRLLEMLCADSPGEEDSQRFKETRAEIAAAEAALRDSGYSDT